MRKSSIFLAPFFVLSQVVAEASLLPAPMAMSEVSKARVSGLSAVADADHLSQLKKQAQLFIDFKRGKMPTKKKLALVAECLVRSAENPFCPFIVEVKDSDEKEKKTSDSPLAVFKVAAALAKGEVAFLSTVSESQILRALRFFPKWEHLKKVTDAALTAKTCPSSKLLTSLALKAEEFFPEESFRKTAVALYGRADECGDADEILMDKGRFRLSLLHVWNGDCKKADGILAKLSNQENAEFAPRALYWRHYCAKSAGNDVLAESFQKRLLQDFPLSYHRLLVPANQKQNAEAIKKVLEAQDPVVKFRSELKPELNQGIQAAEILESMGRNDLADDILDSLGEMIHKAEVPFRLYFALMSDRIGDNIGTFRALSSVFRDDPTLIGRSTLEMFYPLRRFETLKQYTSKVDPFLMAALIRQESGFNEKARSRAGALGLMQLMPATARRMERVSRRELYDAKTNIRLGIRFFFKLLDRYGQDADLALAAYNAGPERVDEWKKRYPTSNRLLFFDLIPFRETRDYVALIGRNYFWYSQLYRTQASSARAPASRKPFMMTVSNTPTWAHHN